MHYRPVNAILRPRGRKEGGGPQWFPVWGPTYRYSSQPGSVFLLLNFLTHSHATYSQALFPSFFFSFG